MTSAGTAASNGEPVVVLDRVTKFFVRGAETITAVARASLELHAGTFTVVRGPSGSGKTTLLNLVLGWDDPDEGTVRGVGGAPGWSSVAVVPQRLGLLEHLTVAENLTLPRRRDGGPQDLADVSSRLGIAHLADRFPADTSLGEQQRVAVARALLGAPRLLVADEPTSHQDEERTEQIHDGLVAAAANGAAVLVATHDPRIAVHATHRFVMTDGHLVPEG